jgi:hypothetical protein
MTENHGLPTPLRSSSSGIPGTSWTQIVLNFGTVTPNAKLFENFFLLFSMILKNCLVETHINRLGSLPNHENR